MKKFLDALTGIAVTVLIWSLCAIETLNPYVLLALLISAGWLVGYTVICSEMRKMGGRW